MGADRVQCCSDEKDMDDMVEYIRKMESRIENLAESITKPDEVI